MKPPEGGFYWGHTFGIPSFCAFVRRLNRSCTGKSHHLSLPPYEYSTGEQVSGDHRPCKKEYGFVFPSSEIYDGLSAVYDYGPYGSELKRIYVIIGGKA